MQIAQSLNTDESIIYNSLLKWRSYEAFCARSAVARKITNRRKNRIPESLADDYRILKTNGHYSAREAAKILGVA